LNRGRINEAAKYVPLERLGITTQCGFGTTKEGICKNYC
jgi:methionine synthase II (cobalamin-independent)